MSWPAGTVTFFFSDVEGSTRLASALGDAFAPVLEAHRRLVRAALKQHHGVEVSTGGDSFFAVFASAPDAALAAIAIQESLAKAKAPEAQQIRVRIGLHTGQAVQVGSDYVGLDVHLAARISDAGHGGQVLISDATHEALAGSLPAAAIATDLGRHRLKDVGPQRIWQLDGPAPGTAPRHFPPLRSLEAHPSNLPVAGSPLVGRERECREVAALVRHASVVTITGAGGIGKSRVAVQTARSMVAGFPDGVFHMDVLATPDAAAVAVALLELVGARLPPAADARSVLLERLRSRDLLLVLDTADRVADLPDLIAAIAGTCPRIRVLLTSRSPLHLSAEQEYPLQPLGRDQSVALFIDRAQAVRSQAFGEAASKQAIERLVDHLDGIPLAIELAAARTRLYSPAALLDRLERRLPALGQGPRDVPDRQRTLHDTIGWSCELLRPAEQIAFRQLGVFVGSFDLPAVESVVAPARDEDPASLLEALVDRSLVTADVLDAAEPRFRLLGPIREYALDALRASGEEPVVRERHARHWLAFAVARLDKQDAPGLDVIRDLDASEADIHGALEWATRADPGLGLEVAGHLGRYWWLRGRVREGLRWLEGGIAALATAETATVETAVLARAGFWAGVLLDDAGRPADAAQQLEACLGLQRELGDDVGIARTLNSLGVVARSMGELDRAQALLQESLERKQALGDRHGVAVSLSGLGVVANDRGEYDEAVRLLAAALDIDMTFGGSGEVVGHANLGSALVRAGRIVEGLDELRIAMPGIAELGDPELVIQVLVSLARTALSSPGAVAVRQGARWLLAADAVRRREQVELHAADRAEIDEVMQTVAVRLPDADLEPLRSEAQAIDLEAALSLADEGLRAASDGS